jgi:Uma2 family endonuclease
MSAAVEPCPPRMTAEEFLAWAAEREFRGELVAGEVVAMAAERLSHARLKARTLRALEDAVRAQGLPCEALPDGVAVPVSEDFVFEPDALLRCGDALPGDAVKVVDPLLVVEIVSPSTRRTDTGTKLAGYFRLASLRHYLIVDGAARTVIHHARATADGAIATRILREGGPLALDPPGLVLDLDALFGPLPA